MCTSLAITFYNSNCFTHIFPYISTSALNQAHTFQKFSFQCNSHFSIHQHSDRLIHIKKFIFQYCSHFPIHQHFNFQAGSYISKNSDFNFQTGSLISKNSASYITHIFPHIKISTFRHAHTFQKIQTSSFRQAHTSHKIQLPILLTFFHTSAFQLSDAPTFQLSNMLIHLKILLPL